MNRKKDKPYLEFGGNVFYINMTSIIDVIRIDPIENEIPMMEVLPPPVPVKKSKSKKVVEPEILMGEDMLFLPDPGSSIQVDISKWEVLRMMIETIMNTHTEIDDKLGLAGLNNNTTIPFKIAFNTLLKYDILQEEE
jgi:hypothetical protein